MNNNFDFGHGFQDIKKAAEGIGEFIRDFAEESGIADFDFRAQKDSRPGQGCDFDFADFSQPRVNRYSTPEGSLVFEFLLPGFEESGIDLGFRGDFMILRAKLPESTRAPENSRFERRRFTLKDIDRREYPVPADRYDQARARAVLRNAVLTVTIPEKEDVGGGIKIEIVKEGN